MLLTPQTETALLAVLCTDHASMSDLLEVQALQVSLVERARVRRALDAMSRQAEERNR